MARIAFGKDKHLVLEISPASVWNNPGSEDECMEYQLGLFVEGKSVFNQELAPLLVAVKKEGDDYLSDFISRSLNSQQGENWTPLEPKVTLYMQPVTTLCCGPQPNALFTLDITLEQNIFAGENKLFGNYSNTGITIRFEATAQDWARFSDELYQEEEDFEEEEEVI